MKEIYVFKKTSGGRKMMRGCYKEDVSLKRLKKAFQEAQFRKEVRKVRDGLEGLESDDLEVLIYYLEGEIERLRNKCNVKENI